MRIRSIATVGSIFAAFAIAAVVGAGSAAHSDDKGRFLTLDRTIALTDVDGRIDHMAIDPDGKLLVIAELGNNSVDVVDLESGAIIHRITAVNEPQGLAFDLDGRKIIVANRGDGTVRLFDTESFALLGAIPLGADADNVRIDPRSGYAVVGYGDGALAIVDVASQKVTAEVDLGAHPEGFQIEAQTGRAFINIPDRRTILAVNLGNGAIDAKWTLPKARWNFPLAIDPESLRVASVFRLPARVVIFDRDTGKVLASAPTCGDSDDVFFDSRRGRLYVACGAGSVDVFDVGDGRLVLLTRILTSSGARTALYSPDLDRLFVAARAQRGRPAAIMVFRPTS